MKKIANITWITYPNFGTYLQAYALQRYIQSLGYDCVILNDESILEKHFNWKWEIKKIAWRMLSDYRAFQRSNKLSLQMYENFKKGNLVIEDNVNDKDYLNNTYDCFVCGSDQIWNPFSLENPKAGFYYADFSKKKKVAYAPSIGVTSVPSEYISKFEQLISGFSFLSAREKQGQAVMESLTGENVANVVDPTLLLDSSEWKKLVKHSGEKGKYVLGYFLTPNSLYINAAKEYAHARGLEFRMLYTDKSYFSMADRLITAGPKEFLQAINDAQEVFTDSFHGSIFASIFRIQFITFKRFGNTIKSQNSRVENLLNSMNIGNRLIGEEDMDKIEFLEKIDFTEAWKRLSVLINESESYLKNALK